MGEYATKDIAKIVGIQNQKVRKYAQALEKAGYKFTRNDRGFRVFTDIDVPLIQEIIKLSYDTGMNIEQIALKVVKQQNSNTDSTIPLISEVAEPMQNEVKTSHLLNIEDERYKTLLDEIGSLKQLILNQQKYIEDRLEQQRDCKSLESLREFQEVKQQLLQIAAAQEKEKKKSFFSKLFKK
ncbi:MerR family transcriptional regulator [Bacillus sp. EB600]|uniref:MerR family transcriptional regulator n=1 Tax=Bacillus sp. EB600 TaxID=2806345 RepID=UPI00210AC854|nr:MerR family transcriptional regulator [Bacillus sp. EB600]MCQ6281307.1 MerR family transcriptional regulator [Bacillus sp. EB600]